MAALPDAGGMPVAPEDQGPLVAPNPQEVLDSLLNAVKICAQHGAGANDTREFGEASKAALAYAQAWAILNPQLDPTGLPLDHHLQMEQQRGANAVALEQVRGANALAQTAEQAAAAPTPVKGARPPR